MNHFRQRRHADRRADDIALAKAVALLVVIAVLAVAMLVE